MARGEPQFRANWTKLILKWIRRLPASQSEVILATIGPATIEEVHAAGVFDWLPATAHLQVTDAVRESLGEGARGFWRDLMHASLSRSLLKPLLEGGLRLFGRSPHSILRMTPQAVSLIARSCGTILVSRAEAPDSTRLTFENLPPPLRRPSWVEVCAGNCEGVLDYLELGGTVTTATGDLAAGRFDVVTAPHA
ncbi:MAG: hypothetical protein JWM53_1251 [bacterium]|nr:hypothetical protein [bacterium]